MHYGVIGQKKGRRRYQNEDGTRTELGKQREREAYRKSVKLIGKVVKNTNTASKTVVSEIQRQARTRRNNERMSEASRMTNAELRRRVDRLQLENKYMSLMNEQEYMLGKNKVDESLRVLKNTMVIVGSAAGTIAAVKGLASKK